MCFYRAYLRQNLRYLSRGPIKAALEIGLLLDLEASAKIEIGTKTKNGVHLEVEADSLERGVDSNDNKLLPKLI